jgi:DNA-binding NtrC family response regulator
MVEPAREAQKTAIRAADSDAYDALAGFSLVVVDGPDLGLRIEIAPETPAPVLVGQSPACALRLGDPHVSRRHLALTLEQGALRIVDCGSSNGSAVNGVRFREVLARGGERVRIGDTELAIAAIDPSVASGAGEALDDATRAASSRVRQLPTAARFGKLVGHSVEIRRLFPLFERLAKADVPLVIEGETGTGKEVLAESLHEQGPRASKPFVVFDCTAVPPTLMESALFGHERGAFTGAVSARKGVFEQADGGTLFLDEIGDLEPSLQAKLLRAIERREVQRVGGDRWLRVDVRLVAATRRDLDRAVQNGQFRDDLFFRLAVARVELPPLRDRRGDVAALARHFWRVQEDQSAAEERPFPASFLARYQGYGWPGNVRELANAIAREHALGDLHDAPDDTSPIEDEADPIGAVLALDLPLTAARERVVAAFERRYVARVVERHGGNVSRAAAASGLARRYFQLLRQKHGK